MENPLIRLTPKQKGDAGEMLVAAELSLAGVAALKVPDGWPGYDIVAQPQDGRTAQRVQVKTSTYKRGGGSFVLYQSVDVFDWLAVVFLPSNDLPERRFFVVPRKLSDELAHTPGATAVNQNDRWWSQETFAQVFAAFENNFTLSAVGRDVGNPAGREISEDSEI